MWSLAGINHFIEPSWLLGLSIKSYSCVFYPAPSAGLWACSVGKGPPTKPQKLSLIPESTWWKDRSILPASCLLTFTHTPRHPCHRHTQYTWWLSKLIFTADLTSTTWKGIFIMRYFCCWCLDLYVTPFSEDIVSHEHAQIFWFLSLWLFAPQFGFPKNTCRPNITMF